MAWKVKLNSQQKLEELLQEIYETSQNTLNFIQLEINKIVNSSKLEEMVMEERAKYGKVLHDFNIDREKIIRLKIDLAKLMNEILKNKGDINAPFAKPNNEISSLNLTELREKLKEVVEPTTINLKQ